MGFFRTAVLSAIAVLPLAGAERAAGSLLRARLAWFQEQKFGLFLHWGPYSQMGCIESWPLVWADRKWSNPAIRTREEMVSFRERYFALSRTFNPAAFDPDSWARAAEHAGMKYVVFTTKHHDGFSMFDTRMTDYRITSPEVPFSRNPRADIAAEVFGAFRKRGFGIGAYFSKSDWHSPFYWKPGVFAEDRNPSYDPAAEPERWARFVEFLHGQVRELMTGYGRIDILWLDGGQVRPPKQDIQMDRLAAMARGRQPHLIMVNRAARDAYEDYRTPEQQVPEKPLDYPWESCITMGTQWSHKPGDTYKSTRQLLHLLVDVVAKGGNLLLNIGPAPDGTLPETALSRLNEIGGWMKVNAEAIHGTRPIAPHKHGQVALTRKGPAAYAIYLAGENERIPPPEIRLSGLAPAPRSKAGLLGVAGDLRWRVEGPETVFEIPEKMRQSVRCEHAWVVKFVLPSGQPQAGGRVRVDPSASPRVRFGAERLQAALGAVNAGAASEVVLATGTAPGPQGFTIRSAGPRITVTGADDSGTLYGALALAERIRAAGAVPGGLSLSQSPAFVLRGPCIGMQKPEVTYDGAMYDYRYTPEEFPFFYDKAQWTRYLDFLVENRMNTLYLWNGHPFTSLLKLPRYPDAQELTDEQLERNIAVFRWLTAEADRRGIWVIQFFYNIHISHALGRARKVPFQHSAPSELTSAYTRYCISEFIRNYPNVGLLMTLGEALAPHHGPAWLTGTIIPGVKDGMRAAGMTAEPPIIVRAHATDIERAIRDALPLYRNIYTMHKYNGESLSWTDVRGEDRRMHESLVKLGSTHIANVHLLSNLEPFRWGSPEYVQQCLQSCRRIGIQGLHLYPLRYWEWPVTADDPPLQQIDRDWIWFAAWARYAWNPDREPAAERAYWIGRLAEKYGTRQAGEKILDAYQLSGVCAPRLLPRLGITGGGRQSFTLGMQMTQLINPGRYGPWTLLWTADGPPGERLQEWAQREWEGKPHEGETPIQVVEETTASAARAVAAAEAAGPHVTRNRDEYSRLLNDTRAIAAMTRYYRAKALAAAHVLRYGHSRNVQDLRRALPLLEESVAEFASLVALTDKTYRQACSLHTPTRRIPFVWSPGRYAHWRQLLPEYERELERFRANLRRIEETGVAAPGPGAWKPLPRVDFKLVGGEGEPFEVRRGARLYTDQPAAIEEFASELEGLRGIRISQKDAVARGVRLRFELSQPAQILVGFFHTRAGGVAAKTPVHEWEPAFPEGVTAGGHPKLNVLAHQLPAGASDLDFGRGAYVVLGFTGREVRIEPRQPDFSRRAGADLDWLFDQ